jgi:hypothetical protein
MKSEMVRAALKIKHQIIFMPKGFCYAIAVLYVSTTLAIAQTDKNQEVLTSEQWPITLEAAILDLKSRLKLCETLEIKVTKEQNIFMLNNGLGMRIRSRYGLWRSNDKLVFSACGYRCHPDDASMKIIEGFWRELQK